MRLPTHDLVRRARERLLDDDGKLGNVSEELLSVQDEVANAEKALLGRVLNLQEARNLYSKHLQVEASNTEAREEIAQLQSEIESLEAQLAAAQQRSVSSAEELNAEKRRLQEVLASMKGMELELAAASRIEAEYDQLVALHARLSGESQHLAEDAEEVRKQLEQAARATKHEAKKEKNLHKALVEMHQYGITCRSHAEQLSKDLLALRHPALTNSAAEKVAEKSAEVLTSANLQHLLAEEALLRSEVERAEAAGQKALRTLREAQEQLKGLEVSILQEERNATFEMRMLKKRRLGAIRLSQELSGTIEEVSAHKALVETQLHDLTEPREVVEAVTVHAENEAYMKELLQMTQQLTVAKASEAHAVAGAQQAEAEVAAQHRVLELASEAVRVAKEEGERQLKVIVEQAAAGKAQSDAMLQRANAAIESQCRTEWELREKDTSAELAQCKRVQEDLTVMKAQKDTLQTSLRAQQLAASSAQ